MTRESLADHQLKQSIAHGVGKADSTLLFIPVMQQLLQLLRVSRSCLELFWKGCPGWLPAVSVGYRYQQVPVNWHDLRDYLECSSF